MELKRYETLDQFIAEYSRKGWQIVSRTDSAVQMRRVRQWSRLGLTLGGLGLLVYGSGLLILILTVIDYLFQRESIGYATLDQLQSGLIPDEFFHRSESCLVIILWAVFIFIIVIFLMSLLAR